MGHRWCRPLRGLSCPPWSSREAPPSIKFTKKKHLGHPWWRPFRGRCGLYTTVADASINFTRGVLHEGRNIWDTRGGDRFAAAADYTTAAECGASINFIGGIFHVEKTFGTPVVAATMHLIHRSRRQTNGQTDRQTNKPTDRQTNE